jgi:predicted secreted protein
MKHSKEAAISWVQTTEVRVLQQMKRTETKTVDEHYTKAKPTCTEVANLPCSKLIIR